MRDGTLCDPFVLVDGAGEGKAFTKASKGIDWLPQNLKDRVDQHRPLPDDIDRIGNANKDRLREEADKLFGTIMNEMVFVNFKVYLLIFARKAVSRPRPIISVLLLA